MKDDDLIPYFEDKSHIAYAEDDRTKIVYKNGEEKVFRDKNGNPVVAEKYLERLIKKKAKAQMIEFISGQFKKLLRGKKLTREDLKLKR